MGIAEPLKEIRNLVETAVRETTLEHHDTEEHVSWDEMVCCECGGLEYRICSTTESIFCHECDKEVGGTWTWREFVEEAVHNQVSRERCRTAAPTAQQFSIAQLTDAIAQHLELEDDASEDRALQVWSQAKAIKSALLDALDLVTGEGGTVDEWLRSHPVGYRLDLGDGRHLSLDKVWGSWKLKSSPKETIEVVATGLGGDFDELAACLSSQPFKPAETAKRLVLADREEGAKATRDEIAEVRERLFTREPKMKPTEGGKKPVRRPTVIDPKFLEAS